MNVKWACFEAQNDVRKGALLVDLLGWHCYHGCAHSFELTNRGGGSVEGARRGAGGAAASWDPGWGGG